MSGSGYDSLLAFAKLSDGNGHTGSWLYTQDTIGGMDSQMRITWVQVGNGNWNMTNNWFSQGSSGSSSFSYFEQDNGLGATLLPGETDTFSNTQLTLGSTSQTKTQTGSFNSFAFTLYLNRGEIKTAKNTWSTSIAALGVSNSGNASSFQVSGTLADETGNQVNGVRMFQSAPGHAARGNFICHDGSDYWSVNRVRTHRPQ